MSYKSVRCHLGFSGMEATIYKIVGPLKSMKYSAIINPFTKFTMCTTNYEVKKQTQ